MSTTTDAVARFDEYHRGGDGPRLARLIRAENERLLRFLIPAGASVLDLGCGDGGFLAALAPGRGVGVDWSATAVDRARERHPDLEFHVADATGDLPIEGTFDYVLLNNVIGDCQDVWALFRNARRFCHAGSRVVATYYNRVWEPAAKVATWVGLRRTRWETNWFSRRDIGNLFALAGFEMIRDGSAVFCPLPLGPVADFFNRIVAPLPLFHHGNVLIYGIARPAEVDARATAKSSVSVIIPTRNEAGNVAAAVARTPDLGGHTELIFVDGDSQDGTVAEIEKQIDATRGRRDIKLIHQVPPGTTGESRRMLKLGKGDAVRKGFAAATGDVLMILDSDLTVPPEDLPKFFLAIAEGRGEFINGNRLSYPLEQDSMRFLNQIANRVFGWLFTWLLGQPVKDTLCGTKVLRREAYERIAANRAYFGDFDPFGDFDLLFGAARLNMKIIDVPVRYRARTYGDIKIERFKHGVLLARMCWFAYRRFKLYK